MQNPNALTANRYVAYLRVSTNAKVARTSGVAAQRQRIKDFIGTSGEVIAWQEQQESGAKSDRAQA